MNKKIIFRYVYLALVIFYSAWFVYQLFNPGAYPELVFDRLTGVILFFVFFYVNEKTTLSWPGFILSVIAFNLHNAGIYGSFIAGIPADRIIHFLTNLALVVIAYDVVFSSGILKKARSKKLAVAVIIFFFIIGIGAFTEIIEFAGYSVIGEGEGILAYGTGDFGEWNNLSWDLISNSLGALAGVLFCTFWKDRKRKGE